MGIRYVRGSRPNCLRGYRTYLNDQGKDAHVMGTWGPYFLVIHHMGPSYNLKPMVHMQDGRCLGDTSDYDLYEKSWEFVPEDVQSPQGFEAAVVEGMKKAPTTLPQGERMMNERVEVYIDYDGHPDRGGVQILFTKTPGKGVHLGDLQNWHLVDSRMEDGRLLLTFEKPVKEPVVEATPVSLFFSCKSCQTVFHFQVFPDRKHLLVCPLCGCKLEETTPPPLL